jgi:hypothetical protein
MGKENFMFLKQGLTRQRDESYSISLFLVLYARINDMANKRTT